MPLQILSWRDLKKTKILDNTNKLGVRPGAPKRLNASSPNSNFLQIYICEDHIYLDNNV